MDMNRNDLFIPAEEILFLFFFLGIFCFVWGWDGAGWFSPAWLESGGGREGGNVLLLMGTREGKSMEATWIIYTMFLSFPFSFSFSTKKPFI